MLRSSTPSLRPSGSLPMNPRRCDVSFLFVLESLQSKHAGFCPCVTAFVANILADPMRYPFCDTPCNPLPNRWSSSGPTTVISPPNASQPFPSFLSAQSSIPHFVSIDIHMHHSFLPRHRTIPPCGPTFNSSRGQNAETSPTILFIVLQLPSSCGTRRAWETWFPRTFSMGVAKQFRSCIRSCTSRCK